MKTAMLAALSVMIPTLVQAQTEPDNLGEVVVTARDRQDVPIGGTAIGTEDLRRFNKASLEQALALASGVNAAPTGGSRNEGLIFVRGFDRLQTTLSIDGVRVFLPADNRIDFARFLTADIEAIQIAKGHVSVLDGPGALGGAINLVTTRPAAPFEGEFRAGLTTSSDLSVDGRSASIRIGGATDRYYLQASASGVDQDAFTVSEDFQPTALEDGGERANSESTDWRVALKAGLTPNATDEYSLNYAVQSGQKNAPYHVSDTVSRRYWDWPEWDLESLYLLSRTQLAEGLRLRTRLYVNRFDNALFAYDDPAQTTQTLPRAFRSFYDDTAIGGTVRLEWEAAQRTRWSLAVHGRRDRHEETQTSFSPPLVEPVQVSEEDTGSVAVELTQGLSPKLDLIVGAAIDWRDLRRAEDFNAGVLVRYPLEDDNAWQAQAALVWRAASGLRLRASASSRTRFPTLFERFSSRFGTAVPNPGLSAERALNLELGATRDFDGGATISVAVFQSSLDDALIQVPVALGPPFGTVQQTRNVGEGDIRGLEIEGSVPLGDRVTLGGNYTWTDRDFTDPTNPAFRPLGVPDHKAFVWLDWQVRPGLTLTPNVELTSDRWTVTSAANITPPRYYRTGAVVLIGLNAAWTVRDGVDLIVGANNLTDEDHTLVDGFPEVGRRVFADLRFSF